MAISYIGSATGTNTFTMPAHEVGDFFVVFAANGTGGSNVSLPAGWTTIRNATATFRGHVAYKIATSTSETPGTWTNANNLVMAQYRGVSPITPVNPSAATSGTVGTSTTLNYPAVFTIGRGTSWVVRAGGHASLDTTVDTAPTGNTARVSRSGTNEISLSDTNGVVTPAANMTVAAVSQSVGGTSAAWMTTNFELIPISSSGVIYQSAIDIQANGTTVTTSTTIDLPANVVDGDFLIMAVAVSSGSSTTISTPSGWTSVTRFNQSTSLGLQIFYKFASGEGSSYTITTSSDFVMARLMSYKNVDTTTPINSFSTPRGQNSVPGTFPFNSVTPTSFPAEVVKFVAIKASSSSLPGDPGLSYIRRVPLLTRNSGTNPFLIIGAADFGQTPTSTTAFTPATMTNAFGDTTSNSVMIAVLLNPSTSTPEPEPTSTTGILPWW